MSYESDGPTEDPGLDRIQVRRTWPDADSNGVAARLDRLEKALENQEQGLGRLASRLSPILGPEAPSPVEGMVSEEPRSELAHRLDRLCGIAEAHLGFIRALSHRVDL